MARWYVKAGYEVLSQNWRTRQGELDLVLGRGNEIVFCEVKARRSDRFGAAAEAVDYRKQARIRSLAAQWLRQHITGSHVDVRFDVATLTGTNLEVFENAF